MCVGRLYFAVVTLNQQNDCDCHNQKGKRRGYLSDSLLCEGVHSIDMLAASDSLIVLLGTAGLRLLKEERGFEALILLGMVVFLLSG